MFVIFPLLWVSLATFVSSFSIQAHVHVSNDYKNREHRNWIGDGHQKYAPHIHCARSISSLIDVDEDSLQQHDGNISYLRNRFGLKDEWFTNNAMYTQIDNMDQSALMSRLDWMKIRLQLNEAQLGKLIQRYPNILTLRPEMNLEPTIQFLQQELALNNTRLSKLIVKHPSILGFGINKNQTLQRNLNWIKSQLHVKDPTKIGKLVVKAPSILALDVENNLEPTLSSLQERLGLNDTCVAKLCGKCPQLLTRSYSQSHAPKLDWLQNTLDLNEKQLGTIIQRQPRLLTYSVDERLRPNFDWLRDRLCVNTRELAKVVTGAPGVLLYQVESMEERLQWFQDHLFLHDKERMLSKFICKAPPVLGMSVKSNLGPTLEFYRENLGPEAATRFVVGNPTVLSYSLKSRLKPRMEQAKHMGLYITMDSTDMNRVCMYTEARWLSWLQKQQRSQ